MTVHDISEAIDDLEHRRLGRQLVNGGGGGDDRDMQDRLLKLETRWDAIIPTLATKADLSETKVSILIWMLGVAGFGLAAMTFIINRAVPAATQNSQPIVIQLSAPTAPVVAPPAAASAAKP